jgi:hypothetical protein
VLKPLLNALLAQNVAWVARAFRHLSRRIKEAQGVGAALTVGPS